jgi:hypothetical protein
VTRTALLPFDGIRSGTVDRGMHCIYKHDLPRTIQEIKPFLAVHKTATRLNDRSCDVIRMAINQHTLALLGMNHDSSSSF